MVTTSTSSAAWRGPFSRTILVISSARTTRTVPLRICLLISEMVLDMLVLLEKME